MQTPFDLKTFKTTKAQQLVVDNVNGDPASGISYFDLSRSGKLVYLPGIRNEELELVWVDSEGKIDPLPLPKKPYSIGLQNCRAGLQKPRLNSIEYLILSHG